MDTLSQVEKSISSFTSQELSLFREWSLKFDNLKWDEELEADIKSGKLDDITSQAIDQFMTKRGKRST